MATHSRVLYLRLHGHVGLNGAGTMPTQPDIRDTIIGLERAALDRWITFDPDGYLALNAAEATEVYALIGGLHSVLLGARMLRPAFYAGLWTQRSENERGLKPATT